MKLLNVKSVAEVKEIIVNNFHCIEELEYVNLSAGLYRVLAQDIISPETLPPFSRSSVDGYAVKRPIPMEPVKVYGLFKYYR